MLVTPTGMWKGESFPSKQSSLGSDSICNHAFLGYYIWPLACTVQSLKPGARLSLTMLIWNFRNGLQWVPGSKQHLWSEEALYTFAKRECYFAQRCCKSMQAVWEKRKQNWSSRTCRWDRIISKGEKEGVRNSTQSMLGKIL